MKKFIQIEKLLIDIIKSVMPTNAEVTVQNSMPDFDFRVYWRLNDPNRLNKMSKTISIIVSREAVQDFALLTDSNKSVFLKKMESFLKEKITQFNPENDSKSCDEPLIESWLITSDFING